MKIPPYLKKGNEVGIVSTARSYTFSDIEPFIKAAKSWGLKVHTGKTIDKSHHQFAGTDIERAKDFQTMLDNPEIKAIFCARGGYGTVRIIDAIDFTTFKSAPKWICGFSDMTILHTCLQNRFETASLHTITCQQAASVNKFSISSLKIALFGGNLSYAFNKHVLNRLSEKQQITGTLVGGNLSVLYSMAGSISDLNTDGKILFLEDLDEYLYHIDRMMMQLKRAGKLKKLKGLVVGSFNDMKDNKVPFGKTAEAIIKDAIEEYDFPIVFDFPAGHAKENYALKMGMPMRVYEHNGQIIAQQNA